MKSIDLSMNRVCFSRGHKQWVSGTAGSRERGSAPTAPDFITLPAPTWSPCPAPAITQVGWVGGGCPWAPLAARVVLGRGAAWASKHSPAPSRCPDAAQGWPRQLLLRGVMGGCVGTPLCPPLQLEPTGALLLAPVCGRGSLQVLVCGWAGAKQLPKPGAAGFQGQLGASEV